MTKRLQFDVQVIVDDDVSTEQATTVVKSMLSDAQQSEKYHDVVVIDSVASKDEAVQELFDVLDRMDDDSVDAAIEAVQSLEDEDE